MTMYLDPLQEPVVPYYGALRPVLWTVILFCLLASAWGLAYFFG